MLLADRIIATALMGLSVYFMIHATVLPIGWVEGEGPGGGAFPFWLSAILLVTSAGILMRSFSRPEGIGTSFFDREMLRPVILVTLAVVATIALMPLVGAYVALPLFLLWYLKIFGGHGWVLSMTLTIATPVFIFFFFEVTLKILLPKGITEPYFLPLYAMFF